MDVPRRLAVGGPRGALGYVVAVGGTILVTLPLLAFRAELSKTTVVLAYLLVVTAAAALDTRCNSQQVEERSSMVVRTTPPGAVRDPYVAADAAQVATTCAP